METIQLVLDSKLRRETERAARRQKVNRSELIRQALRAHLRQLHIRELEERDRAGYEKRPVPLAEIKLWEGVAAWPED